MMLATGAERAGAGVRGAAVDAPAGAAAVLVALDRAERARSVGRRSAIDAVLLVVGVLMPLVRASGAGAVGGGAAEFALGGHGDRLLLICGSATLATSVLRDKFLLLS